MSFKFIFYITIQRYPNYTPNILFSFISNQTMFVKVENSRSNIYTVDLGVPQGSVLRPMLFLVFINDLSQSVNANTVIVFGYLSTHF